jgi:lipid-binding SYLF domain-containing protein
MSALLAAPALAQTKTDRATASSSHKTNQATASTSQRVGDAAKIINGATRALRTLNGNADFKKLLQQAKGVFIVPDLAKGAAVIGGEGGTGVFLVKKNGKWSDPAFFTIGSISIGPQVGGKAGPVVMALMSDKAANSFTDKNNFSLNANAGLTVVKYSAQPQASLGKSDVVVWSGQAGGYAGLDVSGSDIVADSSYDQSFYNGNYGTKEIIAGQVTNPKADGLRQALAG